MPLGRDLVWRRTPERDLEQDGTPNAISEGGPGRDSQFSRESLPAHSLHGSLKEII
jgi:hypothetical protein